MLALSPSKSVAAYLESVLPSGLRLREWSNAEGLPRFLTDAYQFFEGDLFHRPTLFAFHRDEKFGPIQATKQVAQIAKATGREPVLVIARMTAAERRKLIESGISFVVPDSQIYLPQFGMILQEHFRTARERAGAGMSPAAQVLLFDYLLNGTDETVIPSKIAGRLDYTAMTVGRAMDELEEFGLATVEKVGREKHLSFLHRGRDLFEAAWPHTKDPIKDKQPMRGVLPGDALLAAGDSALAHYTDLAPGRLPCFAVAQREDVTRRFRLEPCAPFEADLELETWRYDPRALSHDGFVDRLSLFVQYRDDPDPRVSGAANRLLEEFQWQS